MKFRLSLLFIICAAVLFVSVVPGVLDVFIFLGIAAVMIAPFVIIGGLFCREVLRWFGKDIRLSLTWREFQLASVVMCVTFVMLLFYIPRRVAFAISRPAFESAIAQNENVARNSEFNQRLGVFWVDKFANDRRGGVFFRVHAGPDGIGPDTMSYGFCFRPNREGTPFGKTRYSTYRLGNDWYWFAVSND